MVSEGVGPRAWALSPKRDIGGSYCVCDRFEVGPGGLLQAAVHSLTAIPSQSQGVVQLAIGKQPRIGRDRRAAKLKHQAAVEIEPQNAPIRFTLRVPHSCPVQSPTRC